MIEREERDSSESERELRWSAHEGRSQWAGKGAGGNVGVGNARRGADLAHSWKVLRGEVSPGQDPARRDVPPARLWAGIERTLRVEGLIRD